MVNINTFHGTFIFVTLKITFKWELLVFKIISLRKLTILLRLTIFKTGNSHLKIIFEVKDKNFFTYYVKSFALGYFDSNQKQATSWRKCGSWAWASWRLSGRANLAKTTSDTCPRLGTHRPYNSTQNIILWHILQRLHITKMASISDAIIFILGQFR